MSKKLYKIAVCEEYIETHFIEAESEKEAIKHALAESNFQQPEYVGTDGVDELCDEL